MNQNHENPAHEPITTWFGDRLVTREAVLAWEARRLATTFKKLGVPMPQGDMSVRRAALARAKATIGREAIERRLLREVRWSDRLTRALARASGKRRRVSQVTLFAKGADAGQLPEWFLARAMADEEAVFLLACPDHHLFRPTPARDGEEVWETTGGAPIASRVFITFHDTEGLVTPADPSYPVQMTGAARLADGTLVGGIRHQFRDEDEGVRALFTVEMPWLIGPYGPAAHRWHLACEFTAWIEAATADG
jgi:hypothetical protein